jgi:hypothetical protein
MGSRLTWRVVAASAAGTSHIERGELCQDRSSARVNVGAAGPVLSIFVADGAGSADCGGAGADLAVQCAGEALGERLDSDVFALDEVLARDLTTAIRARIDGVAQSQSRTPRDFACTFLGVLCNGTEALAVQIGDGGIVLDTGDGFELAIVPMAGEYANTTRFVTDDDAMDHLAIRTYARAALRVAAFTDGMQRLVVDMARQAPYEPVFARLFQVLSAATADQEAGLHAALVQFLEGRCVNERTDDDKTLALALRVPCEPCHEPS